MLDSSLCWRNRCAISPRDAFSFIVLARLARILLEGPFRLQTAAGRCWAFRACGRGLKITQSLIVTTMLESGPQQTQALPLLTFPPTRVAALLLEVKADSRENRRHDQPLEDEPNTPTQVPE